MDWRSYKTLVAYLISEEYANSPSPNKGRMRAFQSSFLRFDPLTALISIGLQFTYHCNGRSAIACLSLTTLLFNLLIANVCKAQLNDTPPPTKTSSSLKVDSSAKKESPKKPPLVSISPEGVVTLRKLPKFSPKFEIKKYGDLSVRFSIHPRLQKVAEEAVRESKRPMVAVVLMEPGTGRLLALTEQTQNNSSLLSNSKLPAASLFTLVTAAALLDLKKAESSSKINFFGDCTLVNQSNFLPNPAKDIRAMTFREALGNSCNLGIARLAIEKISNSDLEHYTKMFRFNQSLDFDYPLQKSSSGQLLNQFQFARAAAGLGNTYISPIHAATIISSIAFEGKMYRPSIVDQIINSNGKTLYSFKPKIIQQVVKRKTAKVLLSMLESTTLEGTAKKAFMKGKQPKLPNFSIAGKTGTHLGGSTSWFVGALPIKRPQLSIVVVTAGAKKNPISSAHIAQQIIEKYNELSAANV